MTHWRRNEFDHIYSERYSGDPDWNVPMRRGPNYNTIGTAITCVMAWLLIGAFIWFRL